MKKILALVLSVIMLMTCIALADDVIVLITEAPTDVDVKEAQNIFAKDWDGEYKLVAYYVGADYAEENDVEEAGLFELESDVTLTVTATFDGGATGSPDGVMSNQGAYYHAHAYDVDAVLTVDGDEVVLKCPWDGWVYEAPSEGVIEYASSVGKLSKNLKGDVFMEIIGQENEAFEEAMKYIAMTEDGNMVIAFSEANLCKKGNDEEIGYALIFAPVE